jgi:hypothetical protein
MRYKLSSKRPSRQEIEKLANEIVITIKNTGADPYEEINSTGLSDDLKSLLLRKFNISSFLHDFENHDGDAHIRDVGTPPLSLSTLLDKAPEEVEVIDEPGLKGKIVKKSITGPGVSGKVIQSSQVRDLSDMKNVDIGAPPKPEKEAPQKEAKIARSLEGAPESQPIHRLRGALSEAKERLLVSAHAYKGYIEKQASIHHNGKTASAALAELFRVYGKTNKVAAHLALVTESKLEETSQKYVVSSSKVADSIVAEGEKLLEKVASYQDVIDYLTDLLENKEA